MLLETVCSIDVVFYKKNRDMRNIYFNFADYIWVSINFKEAQLITPRQKQ